MRRAILCFMILTAINLAIFLQIASAIDFQFNSPESAELNKKFSVSIISNISEIHDVKIFVQDQEKNTLSEIFNDGWKSPFYYLKSAFPAKTEFEIQIIKSEGSQQICARLRKPGKTSFDEKCNGILITKPSQTSLHTPIENTEQNTEESIQEPKEETETEQNTLQESIQEPKEETNSPIKKNDSQPQLEQINYQSPQDENTNEKIMLNPKPKEKLLKTQTITTKEGIKRDILVYAFVTFLMIVIILLALKKL